MISARRIRTAVLATVTAATTAAALTITAPAISFSAPAGVDVSGHQHPTLNGIDWDAVKSDGQSFAFVKATEGFGYINGHFVEDANRAAAAGLKVGAYHYARPSEDPIRQAAAFAAQLALVPNQTLPPVLDLEVSEGLNADQLAAWTRTFLTELELLTGRKPMLYTYKYFWLGEMGNTTEFSEYPLWLAAYQDQAPEPVGGWDKIAFWQRSGSGRVAGIATDVDMNLFNGTHAQLETFSAGNYIDFGGVLEDLVIPGLDLSDDARAAIAAILGVAAGAVVLPAVAQALGDADGADKLVAEVQALLNANALPIDELQRMFEVGGTTGDLLLLLDNAAQAAGIDVDTQAIEQLLP